MRCLMNQDVSLALNLHRVLIKRVMFTWRNGFTESLVLLWLTSTIPEIRRLIMYGILKNRLFPKDVVAVLCYKAWRLTQNAGKTFELI